MSKQSVLVGMSGGIDSSVCALLLKEQGYIVYGATLLLKDGETSKKDISDAQKCCEQLGITHYIIDGRQKFADTVISEFGNEYKIGNTPNPCVSCNKFVKIPLLIEKADELGIDFVATGHYVNKEFDGKYYYLTMAEDKMKDQTYVLYSLSQKVLARTLFPMGKYNKNYTKNLANEKNLISADRADSQDICFIPSGDYAKYLRDNMGIFGKTGNFVDKDGNILGKHTGITDYTVGQRRGLGVSSSNRLFVIKKDVERNEIVLGNDDDLLTSTIHVKDVVWQCCDPILEPIELEVSIRYHRKAEKAAIYPNGLIIFSNPQRAPTSGQSAVFYQGNKLIGGGIIK